LFNFISRFIKAEISHKDKFTFSFNQTNIIKESSEIVLNIPQKIYVNLQYYEIIYKIFCFLSFDRLNMILIENISYIYKKIKTFMYIYDFITFHIPS